MNAQLKTILLTVLTLSLFVIALVELSGVSNTALFNKYHIGNGGSQGGVTMDESAKRIQAAASMPRTTLEFIPNTKFSFGSIKAGDVVKHSFHFKNTGTNPLLITKAQASCGCTVPSFPKEPIAPGGEGDILVEFNSSHKEGHQDKNVLIYSNAVQDAMSIGFTADVQ